MLDQSKIRVVGFDADDTLWANEMIFRDAEEEIAGLLSEFEVAHVVQKQMFGVEMANLERYGYGIKGFTLSMVELALEVSAGRVPAATVGAILDIGKRMLTAPVEVLDGVRDTLAALQPRYRLVVVTKGDLLDQERKLERSGLMPHFHHTEVVSNKRPGDYARALRRMDIAPEEFVMVGNSLKSDVLPLLDIGAQAVHVPYHVTWAHEEATPAPDARYLELSHIGQLTAHLLPD